MSLKDTDKRCQARQICIALTQQARRSCQNCQVRMTAKCGKCHAMKCCRCQQEQCEVCESVGQQGGEELAPRAAPKRKRRAGCHAWNRIARNVHNVGDDFIEEVLEVRSTLSVKEDDALGTGEQLEFLCKIRGLLRSRHFLQDRDAKRAMRKTVGNLPRRQE